MLPLFRCCDLDLGPMTLKLNHDLDILKMCLGTENEVARSSHSKYIARIEKVRKQLSRSKVKVKCHQLPTTSGVPHGTYIRTSYIDFRPAVFEIFWGQTHRLRLTDRRRQKQYFLAACTRVITCSQMLTDSQRSPHHDVKIN